MTASARKRADGHHARAGRLRLPTPRRRHTTVLGAQGRTCGRTAPSR